MSQPKDLKMLTFVTKIRFLEFYKDKKSHDCCHRCAANYFSSAEEHSVLSVSQFCLSDL